MKRKLLSRMVTRLVILILLLAGCTKSVTEQPIATQVLMLTQIPQTVTPLPASPTVELTNTPDLPDETPVTYGKVNVNGLNLYLMCTEGETPTIVLDYAISFQEYNAAVWEPLKPHLKSQLTNRICAYDRPGILMSDPPPEQPRTSLDMAEDLHLLLHNANIPGPYVLVTISMANITAQLYAHYYPQETSGMVWISPMHPDEIPSIVAVLSTEATKESVALENYKGFYTAMLEDPMQAREYWDYRNSVEQLNTADTLGDLPMVILTRGANSHAKQLDYLKIVYGNDFTPEVVDILDSEVLDLQDELVRLSTNSKQILVEDTSDHIQYENPRIVVEAIQWVLEQAKSN